MKRISNFIASPIMGSERLACDLISLFPLHVLLRNTSRHLVPHSNGITWAQSGVVKIRSEADIENSCNVILIRLVQPAQFQILKQCWSCMTCYQRLVSTSLQFALTTEGFFQVSSRCLGSRARQHMCFDAWIRLGKSLVIH